jgi:hypothetical protein
MNSRAIKGKTALSVMLAGLALASHSSDQAARGRRADMPEVLIALVSCPE